MISNPYGEILSKKFGVLSNSTEFVNVFINNEFVGLYHLLGRLDESFLRNNKIMPGPIYTGDRLHEKWDVRDFDTESTNGILQDFRYISKSGQIKTKPIYNPLYDLLEVMNGKIDRKSLNEFWHLIDKDKLAAFSALMSVTANTHSDFNHNQAFYFNYSSGRIEPISVDMNILGMLLKPGGKYRYLNGEKLSEDIHSKKNNIPYYSLSLYEKMTPIMNFAFADPSFIELRNKKIIDSINTFASSKNQSKIIDEILLEIDESIRADDNKGYLENTFFGYHRFSLINNISMK